VLVGARLKIHVIAQKALEAADGVGKHYLIGVAYVRLAGGVGYSRCKVKLTLAHILTNPFAMLKAQNDCKQRSVFMPCSLPAMRNNAAKDICYISFTPMGIFAG
jgi:hypothetical protein